MKKRIYIYGAGGLAMVAADTAQVAGWEIAGFIDDTPTAPEFLWGIPVLHQTPAMPEKPEDFEIICAIGNCRARFEISARLADAGYCLATLIHPDATISPRAKIGDGVLICAGSVIDPGVEIGNWSIINKNCSISHGTVIGKACHIAPGSAIAGNCKIGDGVWMGVHSCVIENISIGKNSFIGAGSVVVNSFADDSFAYGVPAKPQIRKN